MTYDDAIQSMARAMCKQDGGRPDHPLPYGDKFVGQPAWKGYEEAARAAARSVGLKTMLGILHARGIRRARR